MILHSVMPMDAMVQMIAAQPAEGYAREIQPYEKGFLEGSVQNGKFTVSRIISTDPSAYLDSSLTIGSFL